MSKPKLILQPGKTYVTLRGKVVTVEPSEDRDPFYKFEGSNGYMYSSAGTLFEDEKDYEYSDNFCDNISNELQSVVSHLNGGFSDNTVENLIFVTPEENRQPKLIDALKFKQKSNGIKRKLTLKDYSDDSVEIIFQTKFSKDEPQVTTGIRLSYEAVLMLFDSLEYMLEENQRTLH